MVQESIFGAQRDLFYMDNALKQAQYAAEAQEIPIGAVIINKNGDCIAQAYNKTEQNHSQTAHAELEALRAAGNILKDWRLTDCWLYVTLEPCIMCMGAIYLSRLAGIVYGASSPLFGSQLDNAALLPVYKVDTLSIITGVRAKESELILKSFFRTKRSSNGNYQQ
ncbi:MAG TPA: nucleoside deaminase [Candidatus Babeliales bacterium]|jgi:tRNA(adenine34) deaminase|nr:nucleoside deaminase [Candidatus Babeliales bacterium]